MTQTRELAPKHPFNTPLEIGLRSLFLLSELFPDRMSTQCLSYFDYLLIHSGDIEDGPPSLHAALPQRTAEWLLRRSVLEEGLALGVERDLVAIHFESDGIFYSGTEFTKHFLAYFSTEYSNLLKGRARWVKEKFGTMPENELAIFMTRHITEWGGEPIYASMSRGKMFE